jgi:hypothetical protein
LPTRVALRIEDMLVGGMQLLLVWEAVATAATM